MEDATLIVGGSGHVGRTFARTLAVPSVAGWLAFDRPTATQGLGRGRRRRRGAAARPPIRRGAHRPQRSVAARGVRHVRCRRQGHRRDRCRQRRAIAGRQEARITALVAARVADILLEGGIANGVHHLETVIDPDSFLRELAARTHDLTLHNVVAHTLTTINVHAAGAAHLPDRERADHARRPACHSDPQPLDLR